MVTLHEGDRISNYILEHRVGAGSFGEVWRARHHVFGEIVAIKVPTDTQYVRNLQREGVAVHGLRHPNIVRAIDMDPYADPPYLIMEYIDGPSLREAIDQSKRSFPIESAVAVMRGVLQALAASHEAGLIHRDIKPANLLLQHPLEGLSSITERAVKVTDFGLGGVGGLTTQTIMQSESLLTEDGRSIAGTLAYMSPEQKEGKDLDARSDLYSCGIVLFEMLTGERPQGGDVPSALRPDIPRYLDAVFQRAYTRLDRRYPSAQEMTAALRSEPKATAPVAMGTAPGPGEAPLAGGPHCPACKQAVHRDDQFCIHCGQQLIASVPHCPNPECRAFVHSMDRYCIFCGTSLQVLKG